MNNLMGLENLPRDVMPYFVIGDTRRTTLKNVALYSIISKTFHEIINSKDFFRALFYLAGSWEFLSEKILDLGCFKDRYCALCRIDLKLKNEKYQGATLGDAWVTKKGVTLVTIFEKLGYLQLTEGENFNSFVFPGNMPLDLGNALNAPLSIARSKDYLAIYGSDLHVHIYSADGVNCLSTYNVTGDIKQMSIQDNRLYVLIHNGPAFNISVYDLEHFKEIHVNFLDFFHPSTRICFGKEYLIYASKLIEGNATVTIPLSAYEMKIHDKTLKTGQSYFFPMEDEFVEVNFSNEFQCDIWKISLKEGELHQSIIKEDLVVGLKGELKDVCLHEDRLLIAYRLFDGGTTLFSYDFLSDQLTQLPQIPSTRVAEETFKPRILCMAEKVYYLFMSLDDENEYKSNLTTFTFSKI